MHFKDYRIIYLYCFRDTVGDSYKLQHTKRMASHFYHSLLHTKFSLGFLVELSWRDNNIKREPAVKRLTLKDSY